MAMTQEQQDFTDWIVDLLQGMGPVQSRRMFGGSGIFLEGLMFGLVAGNVLYLKADEENRLDFEQLGLGPFTYSKQGKEASLSYFQAPEEALESPSLMVEWGNKGFAAALRAAAKKSASGAGRSDSGERHRNSK